jgi:hypothetical protein
MVHVGVLTLKELLLQETYLKKKTQLLVINIILSNNFNIVIKVNSPINKQRTMSNG